jgi:hypothetical protein
MLPGRHGQIIASGAARNARRVLIRDPGKAIWNGAMINNPPVPRSPGQQLMLRLSGFGLLGFCLGTVTILAWVRAIGAIFR